MERDPYYRLYCATQRASQEMMWDSVIDSVERELPALRRQAKVAANGARGSAKASSGFRQPSYHAAADIHLQPGGYHLDRGNGDLAAGAVYDRAVFIYAIGGLGNYNEDLGKTTVDYYRREFPNLKPRRILDMGCAVGHSTLPWAEAFPEAAVYGIDCGAGMVRYAHARARNLGHSVHFSQQNAEATDFRDGFFDVVVSHIMLHETSRSAFDRIVRETYRLLAPGGVMLHLDLPRNQGMKPFDSFLMDWEAYHNNETFMVVCRDLDWKKVAVAAGFSPGRTRVAGTLTHMAQEMLDAGQRPPYAIEFPILLGRK
jgi:SAM-dependent methyltransferase